MAIDLDRHNKRKHVSRTPRGTNPYMKLLGRIYAFLAKRTQSKFAKTVHHRLCLSGVNRPVVSTSKIAALLKDREQKIAVCITTVTFDERMPVLPKMTVCALRFTKTAEQAITKAGGKCLRFDELAMKAPTGKDTLLIRGKKSTRAALKHFGKVCAKKHAAKEYKGKGTKKH
ncbi:60S ribosomal protein L18-B, putative [Entamoeba invadens IP1]|uniref:60S ribosomal protein L18-B, putative n=1 Tax=Entamoeba invadens IP1 TaxID=370355 RepID=A0A0A1UAZ0_ENTIV|nr:60S ribosomal protein L18-B, putative [Entamoeba invadens IP1]ELP92160.1 60S ribosomal protein L18-B, putative [Entamoeba invadens IP1]|eukprot:XP_004258931.1 60S ribosomal protein L18-B, putative [Entamoeba invadens IP1]